MILIGFNKKKFILWKYFQHFELKSSENNKPPYTTDPWGIQQKCSTKGGKGHKLSGVGGTGQGFLQREAKHLYWNSEFFGHNPQKVT